MSLLYHTDAGWRCCNPEWLAFHNAFVALLEAMEKPSNQYDDVRETATFALLCGIDAYAKSVVSRRDFEKQGDLVIPYMLRYTDIGAENLRSFIKERIPVDTETEEMLHGVINAVVKEVEEVVRAAERPGATLEEARTVAERTSFSSIPHLLEGCMRAYASAYVARDIVSRAAGGGRENLRAAVYKVLSH